MERFPNNDFFLFRYDLEKMTLRQIYIDYIRLLYTNWKFVWEDKLLWLWFLKSDVSIDC